MRQAPKKVKGGGLGREKEGRGDRKDVKGHEGGGKKGRKRAEGGR